MPTASSVENESKFCPDSKKKENSMNIGETRDIAIIKTRRKEIKKTKTELSEIDKELENIK
jgi:hypothetical protein